jgi:hypothetical protein
MRTLALTALQIKEYVPVSSCGRLTAGAAPAALSAGAVVIDREGMAGRSLGGIVEVGRDA